MLHSFLILNYLFIFPCSLWAPMNDWVPQACCDMISGGIKYIAGICFPPLSGSDDTADKYSSSKVGEPRQQNKYVFRSIILIASSCLVGVEQRTVIIRLRLFCVCPVWTLHMRPVTLHHLRVPHTIEDTSTLKIRITFRFCFTHIESNMQYMRTKRCFKKQTFFNSNKIHSLANDFQETAQKYTDTVEDIQFFWGSMAILLHWVSFLRLNDHFVTIITLTWIVFSCFLFGKGLILSKETDILCCFDTIFSWRWGCFSQRTVNIYLSKYTEKAWPVAFSFRHQCS